MAPPPSYRVADRSLLLPWYTRTFVAPSLRYVPAGLSPNAITLFGHLLCLAALLVAIALRDVPRGGGFAVVALLIHLYNYCDNADGAHARRTGQTSAGGELLDHGLDLLNTTYVAHIGAMALDVPPFVHLAIAVAFPCTAATLFWEQALLGTLHLGRINQVESVTLVSVTLCARALFGWDFLHTPLGPFRVGAWAGLAVVTLAAAQTLAAVLRALRAKGAGSLPDLLPLALTAVLVLRRGPSTPGMFVAAAAAAHFGMRALAGRFLGANGPSKVVLVTPVFLFLVAESPPAVVAMAALLGTLAVVTLARTFRALGATRKPESSSHRAR